MIVFNLEVLFDKIVDTAFQSRLVLSNEFHHSFRTKYEAVGPIQMHNASGMMPKMKRLCLKRVLIAIKNARSTTHRLKTVSL